jgi:hypothetical protein
LIYDKELNTFVEQLRTKINTYNSVETNREKTSLDIKVLPGQTYYKVMVGSIGKFMLNTINGNLHFITGYGTLDMDKNFGYLPDIITKNYIWDGYTITNGNVKSVSGYAGTIANPRMSK